MSDWWTALTAVNDSPEFAAEIDGVDWSSAYHALSMLTCPWRLRVGICESDCRTEPACETGEPDGGWASELRRACGTDTP